MRAVGLRQRALEKSDWKEYTTAEGKKYYHNTKTKKTVWTLPEDVKEIVEKAEKEAAAARGQAPSRDAGAPTETKAPAASQPGLPQFEFTSISEAEAAFKKKLDEDEVDPETPWEDIVRKYYNTSAYRAMRTFQIRNEAFRLWSMAKMEKRAEERKQREEEQRKTLEELYQSRPEIKAHSSFKYACALLAGEPRFVEIPHAVRKEAFEKHISMIKKRHDDEQHALRDANIKKVREIFANLSLTPRTLWRDAHAMFTSAPEYTADEALQRVSTLDVLSEFEKRLEALETQSRHESETRYRMRRRLDRQRRDDMRQLISELRNASKIHAKAKWKEVYPLISGDPRFLAALEQMGSSPLDMFWDTVAELEDRLIVDRRIVMRYINDEGIHISSSTTLDDLVAAHAGRFASVDRINLRMILEEVMRNPPPPRRREYDRRTRHRMSDFKSVLKRLSSPSIRSGDKWESVQPRVERLPEYQDLGVELCREVFDKFVSSLKRSRRSGDGDGEDGEPEEGEAEPGEVDEEDDRKRRRSSRRDSRDRKHHRSSRNRSRSRSRSRSPSSDGSAEPERSRDSRSKRRVR
nr:PRP40 pre-mRNA processing factor 40 [Polyrhizophydium stewartii]